MNILIELLVAPAASTGFKNNCLAKHPAAKSG